MKINVNVLTALLVLVLLCGCSNQIEPDVNESGVVFQSLTKKHNDLKQTRSKKHYVLSINNECILVNNTAEKKTLFCTTVMDCDISDTVNNQLRKSALSWLEGKALTFSEAVMPQFYCHSNRYLCVLNQYLYDVNSFDNSIFDFITIDMETGERVFLEDLIICDDKFIDYLQQESVYKNWFACLDSNEIKRRLEECSLTQLEVVENSKYTLDESIGSLVLRNTFYVKPGKLGLWLGGIDKVFELDIDDIKSYLRVEPW